MPGRCCSCFEQGDGQEDLRRSPVCCADTGNTPQAHPMHMRPRGRWCHSATGGTLGGGIQGLWLFQGDSLRLVWATTLKEAKGCVSRPRWSPRLGASGGSLHCLSLGTKLECRKLSPLSYLWREISLGRKGDSEYEFLL